MRFLAALLLLITTNVFGQTVKDSIDHLFKAKMQAAGIGNGRMGVDCGGDVVVFVCEGERGRQGASRTT